ncbi:MAG: exodeoxyribonuclease VII large subunit [Chloroflexi bacterium]|nr:exodeoxyribonuclease VII large subunit [Chloroflexota bacterium]
MEIYSVSYITRYIRELFEVDFTLQDIWIRGEVSNLTQAPSGHVYFTLKDEAAQIRCVLWRSQAARLTQLPRDGDGVVAHGRVSVYEAQGVYQFYVDMVQPVGVGLLYLQFEALRKKLESEGLFAPERKRPLPPYPQRIGVITSPIGAAIRDILHVLRRRYPIAEVILAPTLVQGDEAPPQIVAALRALNDYPDIEVIILARGGGSIEELWAFNDERVARAIAASQIPVVTGIGHETDFTIADFVADLRAPTPTAAAEMVAPERTLMLETITRYGQRLEHLMEQRVREGELRLGTLRARLGRASPQAILEGYAQRLDDITRTMMSMMEHGLSLRQERLAGRAAQLQSLDPQHILERGYAVVSRTDSGEVVRRRGQVASGDGIQVRVSDGHFRATVDSKESERGQKQDGEL